MACPWTDHDTKEVAQQERSTGVFRALPFYLAISCTRGPMGLIYPIMNIIIAYWMSGLTISASAFFTQLAILIIDAFSMQVS